MSIKTKMFNKKASNPKNKPDKIIEALKLQKGQNVADIGSGGGYFSLRFAEKVGREGQVYAVDTNAEFLKFIEENARKKELRNLKIIHTTEERVSLPTDVDLIFIRNVCHHLPERGEYFKNLKEILKPEGKIAIIEYTPGGFNFRRIFGHYVERETIVREMEEAGYTVKESFDFLPEQSFTVFSPEL
ncbi:MAG: class I SAM-dependent methyltransferase [Euryarchaeota archaeon]|nr:class I SAM-dependent methyltransferase [Euryarchaeota archaeon]